MYISSMNAPAKKTHKHRPGTVAVRQYHRYRKILPMVVQLQTFVFWSFWEAPQICVPSCRLHRTQLYIGFINAIIYWLKRIDVLIYVIFQA